MRSHKFLPLRYDIAYDWRIPCCVLVIARVMYKEQHARSWSTPGKSNARIVEQMSTETRKMYRLPLTCLPTINKLIRFEEGTASHV